MVDNHVHWGEHLFNVTFPVPNYFPVITIGSHVKWLVDGRRKGGHEPFIATGRIVKLYATTFGGHKRKQAAKIKTEGEYLEIFPGRGHTTVSVDKLRLVRD